MEDIEIIGLYFARSEQAIEETAGKYGNYLGVIAGNILNRPEDIEEVVSDVYLAAWNTIPPNRPNVLKHYLSRIVRNLAFKRASYLSAEKRSANMETLLSELDECIPDERRGPEDAVEAKELGRYINQFLSALPQEDCSLFVSRFYYAMPVNLLAEKYACSARQMKYRLEKLRKRFRSYLRQEGVQG